MRLEPRRASNVMKSMERIGNHKCEWAVSQGNEGTAQQRTVGKGKTGSCRGSREEVMGTWKTKLGVRVLKCINPVNKFKKCFFFWNDFLKDGCKKDQTCLLTQNFCSTSCEEAEIGDTCYTGSRSGKQTKSCQGLYLNVFMHMMKWEMHTFSITSSTSRMS